MGIRKNAKFLTAAEREDFVKACVLLKAEIVNPAEAYVASLQQAAARLPRSQRDDLVAELTGHVDAGIAAAGSEADIRNMLDALGDPADIVAEAAPAGSLDGPPGAPPATLGVIALVLGLLAIFMPFVGIPLAVIAIVLGVTARRQARRAGASTRIGTAAMVLGVTGIVFPLLLWSLLFSARSESHVDSTEVLTTEAVPLPTSTIP
jgi:hypothetical protein